MATKSLCDTCRAQGSTCPTDHVSDVLMCTMYEPRREKAEGGELKPEGGELKPEGGALKPEGEATSRVHPLVRCVRALQGAMAEWRYTCDQKDLRAARWLEGDIETLAGRIEGMTEGPAPIAAAGEPDDLVSDLEQGTCACQPDTLLVRSDANGMGGAVDINQPTAAPLPVSTDLSEGGATC